MKTKICTKCHIDKNIAKFCKDKYTDDGYSSWCRKCRSIYAKKYYGKHKEKLLQNSKNHYKKNKEKVLKVSKRYRENNKEKIQIRDKQYYKENKKRMDEISKKYHNLNPWYGHYHHAEQRCNNFKHDNYKYYGSRGIKMLMIPKDFKFLWFRDKAYLMDKPSIDRKDSDGNYTLKNCRFIEFIENVKRNKLS